MSRDSRLKGQDCCWAWGGDTVSAQGHVCAGGVSESVHTGVHACTIYTLMAVPVCPPAVCSEWVLGPGKRLLRPHGMLGAITPIQALPASDIHTS